MSHIERVARLVYDVRFLLIVVIVTVLLAILIPIKQNRITNQGLADTLSAIRETQIQNRDTNDRIRSCVDPEGTCYKAGQARSANLIKQLQQYTILANACSVILVNEGAPTSRSQAEQEIKACVEAAMREGNR